jgi:hypothetical protein
VKILESNALREARMLTKAKQAVLTSDSWLTIDDIAKRTNSTVELTGALLLKWEREHQIFSIQHEGTDYYPSYIFEQDFLPHPSFASVLKVFATDKGSWKPAFCEPQPPGGRLDRSRYTRLSRNREALGSRSQGM